MKKFWMKKIIGFIVLAVAVTALLGYVVMSLWNCVLVAVLHVSLITFWQALGILILSKILFGGFKGRWGGGPRNSRWGKEMREKWQTMTPEEREKLKQEWRNRCHSWKRNGDNNTSAE